MHEADNSITDKLRQGDQSALKHLFDVYYADLVIHSVKMVRIKSVAEEIVQDVFIEIWKNRHKIALRKSVEGYLFTSVKNRSINYLKSKYARIRFEDLDGIDRKPLQHTGEDEMSLKEIRSAIREAIELLPPRCKIIFSLSRNSGLTNNEIAGHLGISKKTVQSQIAIAIKKIRAYLETKWDNLPI